MLPLVRPVELSSFYAWAHHDDALRQAGALLQPDDLDRFAAVAVRVLCAVDDHEGPSRHLHEGVARTVALLGSRDAWFPEEVGARARAARIVSDLLAAEAPERWIRCAGHLPILAEAAPDAFLDALSGPLKMVAGSAWPDSYPAMRPMTLALETLALNEAWMPRAVAALAQIAALASGEATRKSALASLVSVFEPLLPQTTAPMSLRLEVLEQLRSRHPQLCWDLLAALLQPGRSLARARRPLVLKIPLPPEHGKAPASDVYTQVEAFVDHMLALADAQASRWAVILDLSHNLPEPLLRRVLGRCERLAAHVDDAEAQVWAALRRTLRRLHGASDTPRSRRSWQTQLRRVEALYARLTPADLARRHAWLFSEGAHPPQRFATFSEASASLSQAQAAAIAEIGERVDRWSLLARLSSYSTMPGGLAYTVFQSELAPAFEAEVLARPSFVPFERIAPSFLAWRLAQRDFSETAALLRQLVGDGRVEDAAAVALASGGTDERAVLLWDLLDELGEPLRGRYWQGFGRPYSVDGRSSASVERMVRCLLAYDQIDAALVAAIVVKPPLPVDLALTVLEREVARSQVAAQEEEREHLRLQGGDVKALVAWMFDRVGRQEPHRAAELLRKISPQGDEEIARAAAVEQALLPFLGRLSYKPRFLPARLAQDPSVFITLVRESPRAAEVLAEAWSGYPGEHLPENERDDYLYRYLRTLLVEEKGAEALSVAATLLERPPAGADGRWPTLSARRLLDEFPELKASLMSARLNQGGHHRMKPSPSEAERRQTAARYRRDADSVRSQWPQTAALYENLAQHLEFHAAADREEAQYEQWRDTQMQVPALEQGPLFPLQQVHLENFRAIKELTLALHPRLTVLYGLNACGKTTILDGVAACLAEIQRRLPRTSQDDPFALDQSDIRTTWPAVGGSRQSVPEKFTRIQVTAQPLRRGDEACFWSVELPSPARSPEGVREHPTFADAMTAIDGQLRSDEGHAPMPVFAYYGVERAMSRDAQVETRPPEGEVRREAGLEGALDSGSDFMEMVRWFRLQEDLENEERLQRDRSFELPVLRAVRGVIEATMRAPDARCHAPRVDRKRGRLLVEYVPGNGSPELLELGQLSDGFRTHLALVMDLALRMMLCNPPLDGVERDGWGIRSYAVVLIDEIDLHLFPAWQQTVVPRLLEAFPNTQFLVTTHSEQVLSSVDDREYQVYHLVREGQLLRAEPPPMRLYGATSERVQEVAMEVDQRPPGEVKDLMRDYRELVDAGKGTSPEALELRRKLVALQPEDPELDLIDLQMKRMKFFG